MGLIKSRIYGLYKKNQNKPFIATISSYFYVRIYNRLIALRSSHGTSACKIDLLLPKIAFVCDEMTWQDFKGQCNSVFVTPYNWRKVFNDFQPDLFFCESAWSGINEYQNCWRGRIYKSKNIRYENRRELMKILDYCRKKNIPTAFWNKEDPTFWGNESYNFVDTALHFDHVFTTSQECISKYKELGHTSVHVLMFGFSPDIFFYDPSVKKEEKAVFAGSWYADQPKRCADMEALFNMVLKQGIPLEIYDRQSGSSNPVHKFPEKYRKFIHPNVPYTELGKIYQQAEYAININTVTNSETMFARRVFEVMACGCIVISNDSIGLKQLFSDRIWFLNENFDMDQKENIRNKNLEEVYKKHTCEQRIRQVMEICGL